MQFPILRILLIEVIANQASLATWAVLYGRTVRHRTFANGGGDALYASGPDVSNRDDAVKARLEQIGGTGQQPFGSQVGAGLDEMFIVEGEASSEPCDIICSSNGDFLSPQTWASTSIENFCGKIRQEISVPYRSFSRHSAAFLGFPQLSYSCTIRSPA